MTWHNLSVSETAKLLDTDIKNGLSPAQAKRRLESYGENKLAEKKRPSFFVRFLAEFNDFMIIILLIAAAVSFVISIMRHDADFVDPVIILVIVILNALLGVIQENKAEKSLDALKKISAPYALVKRGTKQVFVPAMEVVPGDILILRTGDVVAADARLISSVNLQTDEASLTGESVPVSKNSFSVHKENTPLAERDNLVLASTSVVNGHGEAIVVKTGMDTEVGTIAGMILTSETEQTPLQKRLADVGKVLGMAALLICSLVFIFGLMRSIDPFEMFMTSVSLAVAAIPEGLPAIVTIVLAIGVQRMVRKNAIIRHLPSVETLGSASVICSDKTGTLTQNKMKVTQIYSHDDIFTLKLAALCSNVVLENGCAGGNPTENAIVEAASSVKLNKSDLDKKYPRIDEIPFNSKRKLMSTVHFQNGGKLMITKGAPDILLNSCSFCYDGSRSMPLTSQKISEILKANENMANNALRVIAVAYKELHDTSKEKLSESNLIFVGLIGMIDPPRPEVAKAVSICKKAGIRPVMVTGDHVLTATAIAREIGIMSSSSKAVTGAELDMFTQSQLEKHIHDYSVFARVTPEHKVRIVKAFKARGEIVAMTGDGVNDAPALKAADIGCAMGIGGTEVAKSAADMILTDDNFATIVEAVRQGRSIFANIKKAIQFLLSSNIGEIITIFVGMLFGWAPPLVAIQLLWVNLITDSLPAIALGVDPADKYIMDQKPRKANKGLFADGLGITIALEGFMIGALALLAFSIGKNIFDITADPIIGRTMAFAVLSISQLVHAFNMRSDKSAFSVGIFKNRYLVGAFIIGILLQVSVISMAPLAKIFKVSALSAKQWGFVAFLSVMPLALVELQKRFSAD
ncbi:MAG: calcium-translocating P-type ATPase, PMCA-type [Clostridia bacterium]|nr:calcium-translocating P-type ATPase, PMCA-type [Clostridia bacterium]